MTFETFAQTYGSHSFTNQSKGFLEREVWREGKKIFHTTKHFHLEKDGTLRLYTFTGEQGKEVVTIGDPLLREDFKDTSVYDAMLLELDEVAKTLQSVGSDVVVETTEISPTEALDGRFKQLRTTNRRIE